jgi:peptidoglycan/xylan/chitin deacetylase (PgdA/CDA1 family)
MRLRHRLFAAGFQVIDRTRADRWLRFLSQGRGLILMFHHVRPPRPSAFAPNRLLEITPNFFDFVLTELRHEGFEIVPLAALPQRLDSDRHASPFAVLTFDDGYRDNLEHAWPILRRHHAPWTLFVTTEFADGRGRLWWLELEEAIRRLDRVVLTLDGELLNMPSRAANEKRRAFDTVYTRLRNASEEQLRAATRELAKQAGVNASRLASEFCLNWSEVQSLAREPDVTIGAHTLSHPMLAKCDAMTAEREIAGSKLVLERHLARPIRHFAYPFGDAAAAGTREFRLARQAGFLTATTSRPGHVFSDHGAHLHALPRVSINGLFQNRKALRALLSGVPFLLWNRGQEHRSVARESNNHHTSSTGFAATSRFIFAVAAYVSIILSYSFTTAVQMQAQVPSIDIKQTCRAAATVMIGLRGATAGKSDFDQCVDSEQTAHQKLLEEWNKFEGSDRMRCVQQDVYLPSYIEWLTCFEMNKAAREGRNDRGETAAIDTQGPVVLPRVFDRSGLVFSPESRGRGSKAK